LQLSFSGATPSTAISRAGSTSTTSVSVSPGGGFKGAVNLTCAVTGASSGDVNIPKCSFKPGAVTITDTQSVQATLTVTTTAAGTTAAAAAQGGVWSIVRGGTMVACVLFFGFAGRRRSLAILCVLLCAFSLGGMMACGGTAGNGDAPPAATGDVATGTTPDTYTVTFHAADAATGTVTAQNSFTLTVN
jgi:hypothetical protein